MGLFIGNFSMLAPNRTVLPIDMRSPERKQMPGAAIELAIGRRVRIRAKSASRRDAFTCGAVRPPHPFAPSPTCPRRFLGRL